MYTYCPSIGDAHGDTLESDPRVDPLPWKQSFDTKDPVGIDAIPEQVAIWESDPNVVAFPRKQIALVY